MYLYIFCVLWIQIVEGILCDAGFIAVMQNVRSLLGMDDNYL